MTQTLSFVVGACLCLALAVGFMTPTLSGSGGVVACEGEKINPNEAPVASLTRLPGIGLTRARTIVAYREEFNGRAGSRPGDAEQGPVFGKPEDLRRIKGIGPEITEDVRPWLQFEMSSADTTADSPR